MKEIILQHYKIYPKMQNRDLYKLVFQNNFGSYHVASKSRAFFERLEYECNSLDFSKAVKREPMFQSIGNGLMRVNLRMFIKSGGSIEKLSDAFFETSILHKSDEDKFRYDILKLKHMIGNEIDTCEPVDIIDTLAQAKQMVSHTILYNELYAPAYRIVLETFAPGLFSFPKHDTEEFFLIKNM